MSGYTNRVSDKTATVAEFRETGIRDCAKASPAQQGRFLKRLRPFYCALLLSACAHPPAPITVTRPVEVPVPVPVACTPPAELTADMPLPQPTFRLPTDKGVTSGLLPADESALMERDGLLRQRLRAWASWGGCPR